MLHRPEGVKQGRREGSLGVPFTAPDSNCKVRASGTR